MNCEKLNLSDLNLYLMLNMSRVILVLDNINKLNRLNDLDVDDIAFFRFSLSLKLSLS